MTCPCVVYKSCCANVSTTGMKTVSEHERSAIAETIRRLMEKAINISTKITGLPNKRNFEITQKMEGDICIRFVCISSNMDIRNPKTQHTSPIVYFDVFFNRMENMSQFIEWIERTSPIHDIRDSELFDTVPSDAIPCILDGQRKDKDATTTLFLRLRKN